MRTPTRPRARSLALGATSAALALALVGCGSDDGSDDAASSTSESSSPSQDPSSEPSEPSEPSEEATETPEPTDEPAGSGDVELLDAGSGDMEVLQLDLQEGQTETTTLTFATQTQGAAGAIPPITATTTTEVTGVDDDGIEATQTFDRLRAQGGGAAANRAFAGLRGIEVDLELGLDGSLRSADVDIPDSAPAPIKGLADQLGEQLTSAAVPFPTEEVGEGARWRATTQVGSSGVTIDQTTTYTLTSLDGDSYTLDVELEQDFGGQGSGTGTGTVEGSTTQLSPSSSQLSVTSEIGGQSVQVDTQIESSVD